MSGCRLRLECHPPDGYPNNITVSWNRNGQALTPGALGLEFSSATRVLVIDNPTHDDSGSYQCRASNGIGITRKSKLINITVQGTTNEACVQNILQVRNWDLALQGIVCPVKW